MARDVIREWKRAVQAAWPTPSAEVGVLARESALHLLDRSIRFGHGRLAVLRLSIAVQAGAYPSKDQWQYCSEVALDSGDVALQAMLEQASTRSEFPIHLLSANS